MGARVTPGGEIAALTLRTREISALRPLPFRHKPAVSGIVNHPGPRPMIRLVALVCGTIALAAPALAKTPFDGRWSVLIVTEQGTCDRAYRYPLKIENGNVLYAGRNNFQVSGKVSGKGAVSVTVASGNRGARGTGRLRGKYGRGTWRALSGECSGRWEADRRG
jgi:hypothetical protein